VRRDRLTESMDRLKGICPLRVDCLPSIDEASLGGVVERFETSALHWKRLLKPSFESSALNSFIARRLALPVLGFMMVVLIANFAVSSRVNGRLHEVRTELAVLRKASSATEESNDRRQAVTREFARSLPLRPSRLSDRVAAATPEAVTLVELSIAPLVKAPEAGKPVQQNANAVVIRGETRSSETITEFTEALGRLGLGEIRLVGVEQNGERDVLTFRIEITI